jgi:hypothetical protein
VDEYCRPADVVVLMVDVVAGAHDRCPCCPGAAASDNSVGVDMVAASLKSGRQSAVSVRGSSCPIAVADGAVGGLEIVAASVSERKARPAGAALLLVPNCGSEAEVAAGYCIDPDRLQGAGKHPVPEIGDE